MHTQNKNQSFSTNDQIIRRALRAKIECDHKTDPALIIEELGVNHGSTRADIAAVNGIMHCYEIKSDKDTLLRLPEQIKAYNAVFDRVTLVVGFSHVYEALELIPDWWGVTVAKQASDGVVLHEIRQAAVNGGRDGQSIARLLWRGEALAILEELDQAYGFRSKPRSAIYEKLADTMEVDDLSNRVKKTLCLRYDWQASLQQA
jgi:hypothetical protein